MRDKRVCDVTLLTVVATRRPETAIPPIAGRARPLSRNGRWSQIGVPAQRIGEIVAGKRAIAADTDLRLCRFFGLSSGYWLRAQAAYDTEVAEAVLAKALAKIKPWAGNAP